MIQVYTGDGKGKTTAALGLAIRAAGASLRVYIGQFIKARSYSELKILRKVPNIKIEQFGSGCFISGKARKRDIELANRGLRQIEEIVKKRIYDLIILDEINVALNLGLVRLNQIVDLIKSIPKDVELVLTGRQANSKLLKLADLVSEVKEIKHYYKRGIKARKGIEF